MTCPVLAVFYRKCGFRPAPKERKCEKPEPVEVPTMYNTDVLPKKEHLLEILEEYGGRGGDIFR